MFLIRLRGLKPSSLAMRTSSSDSLHRRLASCHSSPFLPGFLPMESLSPLPVPDLSPVDREQLGEGVRGGARSSSKSASLVLSASFQPARLAAIESLCPEGRAC